MLRNYKFIFISLVFSSKLCWSQTWSIPIYFPEYSRYIRLSNDVRLNDTVTFVHSPNIYFRFVFFDKMGKSYCEVYKKKKLYEKGYYENSLDTLKRYSSSVKGRGKRGKISVLKYFEPLKNGVWIETVKGKLKRKNYAMGEGVLIQAKVLSSSGN